MVIQLQLLYLIKKEGCSKTLKKYCLFAIFNWNSALIVLMRSLSDKRFTGQKLDHKNSNLKFFFNAALSLRGRGLGTVLAQKKKKIVLKKT